jgi:hypothetical protein
VFLRADFEFIVPEVKDVDLLEEKLFINGDVYVCAIWLVIPFAFKNSSNYKRTA